MFAVGRSAFGAFIALVLLLGAPVAAQAADPPAPAVVTLPATDVTATSATLHAKVTPVGPNTTAYFAYGTAPDQLTRETLPIPVAGLAETDVTDTLPRLAANTKYYVVAVVEDDNYEVTGAAVEVQTPAPPVAAEIRSGSVGDITFRSATLHLDVAAHGRPTTVSGSIRSAIAIVHNVRTGGVETPFGPVTVTADGDVAIPLGGLEPGVDYSWTATATNGTGRTPRSNGSFRTTALIAMPRVTVDRAVALYGSHIGISGRVDQPNLPLTLSEQPFPFNGPIVPIAGMTVNTGADGAFHFDIRVDHTTAFGVAGGEGTAPPAVAQLVRVRVAPVVTARLRRARHHRFVVSGSFLPAAGGKVSLNRRGAGRVGVVVSVKGGRFAFPARALRPGKYEVRVAPPEGTGLVVGKSAALTVPKVARR